MKSSKWARRRRAKYLRRGLPDPLPSWDHILVGSWSTTQQDVDNEISSLHDQAFKWLSLTFKGIPIVWDTHKP